MTFERRTAVVPIYTGDYLDRLRRLESQAEAALERGDDAEVAASVAEHAAVRDEAEARALRIRLEALPRKVWRALVNAHPPREDHETDRAAGVNEDEFAEALLAAQGVAEAGGRYATIVDPAEFDVDQLADVDYTRLYLTAFALNRGAVSLPRALTPAATATADEAAA